MNANAIFSRVLLSLLGLPILGLGLSGIPAWKTLGDDEASGRVPVVVELFTSEGCSTCPPADALLAKLEELQPIRDAEVIALEEHVDYWNNQGWIDPFSSRDWTARQADYAEVLGNRNPYTPQMVVDGGIQFVGSRAQEAQKAIVEAAARKKIPVFLAEEQARKAGVENLSVRIGKLTEIPKGDSAEVWLAVTEAGLHSSVSRGENKGKELYHAAVARKLQRLGKAEEKGETSFEGAVEVPLKREWNREHLNAVVFVQEKKSRRILGAGEMRIGQEGGSEKQSSH